MLRIEAGGLVFEVENRTLGQDGGPALQVFGDADGKQVQVLRFDCFRSARTTTTTHPGRTTCTTWRRGPTMSSSALGFSWTLR